jgi:hypothetical protein
MEILLKENKKDILLNDFIKQLETFLSKEHDVLFNENKLKYMIFLENFKENIGKIADLKNKDSIEINELIFKLYELPKKRNNLLLIYLLYFYIKNKNNM